MAANAGASSLGGTGRVIQVRIQNSVAGLRGAVIVVRSRHQITVATAIESNAKLLIFLKCVLPAQGGEVGLKTAIPLAQNRYVCAQLIYGVTAYRKCEILRLQFRYSGLGASDALDEGTHLLPWVAQIMGMSLCVETLQILRHLQFLVTQHPRLLSWASVFRENDFIRI